MSTVTVSAPARKVRKPRPKPARFCKITRDPSGFGFDVLTIRQPRPKSADLLDCYAVECFPSEMGGRGLELTKPDGTVYHVRLDGKLSECSCPGFESHGWHIDRATGEWVACKHVMALLALAAAELLDREPAQASVNVAVRAA